MWNIEDDQLSARDDCSDAAATAADQGFERIPGSHDKELCSACR